MRRHFLAVVAPICATLACANGASSAGRRVVQSGPTRHLFIAVVNASENEVLRYPFVNGFPAQQPDLAYLGVTSPIATGRDGTLYATTPCWRRDKVNPVPPG